jgi:hypothetical protein
MMLRRLRRAAAVLGLGAVTLAGLPTAQAQTNLGAMRQKLVPTSVQQCRDLLQRRPQLDSYAPAAANARETYCSCVGQAYVANMPDNVVLAFATNKLPTDHNEQAARMKAAAASLQAARARCSAQR